MFVYVDIYVYMYAISYAHIYIYIHTKGNITVACIIHTCMHIVSIVLPFWGHLIIKNRYILSKRKQNGDYIMTSLLGASSELLVVATISLYQRLERLRLRL